MKRINLFSCIIILLVSIISGCNYNDEMSESSNHQVENAVKINNYYLSDSGFELSLNSTSTMTITSCNSYKSTWNIPEKIKCDGKTYTVNKIQYNAFAFNKYVEICNMPSSIIEIGEGAFRDCPNLHTIKFSEQLTEIPSSCCNNCSIRKLEIPSKVNIIGEYAFRDCPINSLSLPDGLKRIYCCAFYGNLLKTLTLGKNITEISDQAFYSNTLSEIHCKATTPPQMAEVYGGTSKISSKSYTGFSNYKTCAKKLYVPKNSVEKYKKDKAWGIYYHEASTVLKRNGSDWDYYAYGPFCPNSSELSVGETYINPQIYGE